MSDGPHSNSRQPMAAIANELHVMNASRVKGLAQLQTISSQIDKVLRAIATLHAARIDQSARLLRLESEVFKA